MSRVVETVKDEGTAAAYRIAAKKAARVLRAPLLSVLKSKGAEQPLLTSLESFLNTEWGLGVFEYIIGMMISSTPKLAEHPKAQKLASEMRIDSMAIIGGNFFDAIIDQIKPLYEMLLALINEQPELPGIKSPPLLVETTATPAIEEKKTRSRTPKTT
jgi:hypothetical protein